jgi:hypothetical protein
MKLPVFAFLACSLHAQITITTSSNSDGRLRVTLTNHAKAPLTAYFATYAAQDQRPGHIVLRYIDSLIEVNQPVPADGSISFNVEVTPPEIHAALFEDGTTWGDPDYVRLLLERRGFQLAAIEAGLSDVQKGGSLQDSLNQRLARAPALPVPGAAIQQIFHESDAAMKAANLRTLEANEIRGSLRIVYHLLIRNAEKPDALKAIIRSLESKHESLAASKPPPIR